jgi:hypothetical protein
VGTSDEDINRWGQRTWNRFSSLASTAEGARAGVQFITCHNLTSEVSDVPASIPAWAHIAHNFTVHSPASSGNEAREEQTVHKSWAGSDTHVTLLSYGEKLSLTQEFGTYIVDQTYYLPFLAAQVSAFGVQQYKHKVESFHELADSGYKVVFNCTGTNQRQDPIHLTMRFRSNFCLRAHGQFRHSRVAERILYKAQLRMHTVLLLSVISWSLEQIWRILQCISLLSPFQGWVQGS